MSASPGPDRPPPQAAPPQDGGRRPHASTTTSTTLRPCPRYRSDALFDGAQEVHIEHDSQLYRLRRTALGKLILTK
jgi:hemin uptake protein HemP